MRKKTAQTLGGLFFVGFPNRRQTRSRFRQCLIADLLLSFDVLYHGTAVDPPRSKTFPVAVTFCPANGEETIVLPLDGVVSAMGQ